MALSERARLNRLLTGSYWLPGVLQSVDWTPYYKRDPGQFADAGPPSGLHVAGDRQRTDGRVRFSIGPLIYLLFIAGRAVRGGYNEHTGHLLGVRERERESF